MPFHTDATIGDQPKMKVALCTVPMLGHLVPLLPYAAELIARGHQVAIFHDSDPKYRRKIEQCGLGACESVTYSTNPGDTLFDRVIQSHYSSPPSAGENEEDHGAAALDIVVFDFFAVDAADAADALGLPSVGVFPNPRSINPWAATRDEQASLQWTLWRAIVCKGMEAVLARILWVYRARTRWRRSLPILPEQDIYPSPYMPRPIIGCSSPALEFSDLPSAPLYHMVGPAITAQSDSIPEDLAAWLDAQEKPIVYVAFGTMHSHTIKSVRKLEADLLKLDVAVVWSLPANDQSNLLQETLPDHWKVQSFFPQVSLLKSGRISAFVTHCGSNSVYEALLCGVPMVCCPGFADQPANASRLTRAGVGVIVKKGNTATALQELLDNLDTITERSMELSITLESHNGANHAASLIEKLAGEGFNDKMHLGPGRWPWWPTSLAAIIIMAPLLAIFL